MRQLRWWWSCVLLKWAASRMRHRHAPPWNHIADDVDRIRYGIERLRREYRTESEDLGRPEWNEAKERSSEALHSPNPPEIRAAKMPVSLSARTAD